MMKATLLPSPLLLLLVLAILLVHAGISKAADVELGLESYRAQEELHRAELWKTLQKEKSEDQRPLMVTPASDTPLETPPVTPPGTPPGTQVEEDKVSWQLPGAGIGRQESPAFTVEVSSIWRRPLLLIPSLEDSLISPIGCLLALRTFRCVATLRGRAPSFRRSISPVYRALMEGGQIRGLVTVVFFPLPLFLQRLPSEQKQFSRGCVRSTEDGVQYRVDSVHILIHSTRTLQLTSASLVSYLVGAGIL